MFPFSHHTTDCTNNMLFAYIYIPIQCIIYNEWIIGFESICILYIHYILYRESICETNCQSTRYNIYIVYKVDTWKFGYNGKHYIICKLYDILCSEFSGPENKCFGLLTFCHGCIFVLF